MHAETRRRRWLAASLALALAGLPVASLAADLPALVRQAKPAVVLVGSWRETDSPRFRFRGTGFAVGDGLSIVTNAHVLPQPTETGLSLQVQVWRDGRWSAREASLVKLARDTDLALLRIGGEPLPPLALAPAAPLLAEGSAIALMGFPVGGALGFSHVVHGGLVASVTPLAPPQAQAGGLSAAAVRALRDGAGFDIYQLDAVAYPGNSGGPLFDVATGQVVGVINMVLTKAGRESALSSPTGISYAIPVAQVHALLAR